MRKGAYDRVLCHDPSKFADTYILACKSPAEWGLISRGSILLRDRHFYRALTSYDKQQMVETSSFQNLFLRHHRDTSLRIQPGSVSHHCCKKKKRKKSKKKSSWGWIWRMKLMIPPSEVKSSWTYFIYLITESAVNCLPKVHQEYLELVEVQLTFY